MHFRHSLTYRWKALKEYFPNIYTIIGQWCKFWRGIYLSIQNWYEELDKFWPVHTKISKLWTLMSYFWPKHKTLELRTTQRSYFWLHWRMQNLERTWLVNSKLIWRIWQILTRALKNLKNLNFNEQFLTKVYNAWTKKSTEELCLIALKINAKFEGRLTCTFWNDIKNLTNFHQSTFESLQFGTFIGSFYPK